MPETIPRPEKNQKPEPEESREGKWQRQIPNRSPESIGRDVKFRRTPGRITGQTGVSTKRSLPWQPPQPGKPEKIPREIAWSVCPNRRSPKQSTNKQLSDRLKTASRHSQTTDHRESNRTKPRSMYRIVARMAAADARKGAKKHPGAGKGTQRSLPQPPCAARRSAACEPGIAEKCPPLCQTICGRTKVRPISTAQTTRPGQGKEGQGKKEKSRAGKSRLARERREGKRSAPPLRTRHSRASEPGNVHQHHTINKQKNRVIFPAFKR